VVVAAGGTIHYGTTGEGTNFDLDWMTSFSGTLNVAGNVGGSSVTTIGAGSSLACEEIDVGLVDLDGGTLTTDHLKVAERTGAAAWTYRASGTGGLTYDTFSLDAGGRMVALAAFDATRADFAWNGGQLVAHGALTVPKVPADFLSPVDHYEFGTRSLALLTVGNADLSDAPTVLSAFGTLGSEVVSVGGNATLTTAQTVLYKSIRIHGNGHWVSTGEVAITRDPIMGMGSMPAVSLDGGVWESRDLVRVGTEGGMMGSAGGRVDIPAGGYWWATDGYLFTEDPMVEGEGVYLTGGTLEYGTTAAPLTFSPTAMLAQFTGGRLIVHGSVAGELNVRPGTTINGTAFETVINGGLFLPGFSPAASVVDGNYTQAPGATLGMDIWGDEPGVEYDTLEITGLVSLAGKLEIDLGNYRPGLNAQFDLFDWTPASVSGTFSEGIDFSQAGYAGSLDYGSGTLTVTGIPEPSAAILLAGGALALALRRRMGCRQRSASRSSASRRRWTVSNPPRARRAHRGRDQ